MRFITTFQALFIIFNKTVSAMDISININSIPDKGTKIILNILFSLINENS